MARIAPVRLLRYTSSLPILDYRVGSGTILGLSIDVVIWGDSLLNIRTA